MKSKKSFKKNGSTKSSKTRTNHKNSTGFRGNGVKIKASDGWITSEDAKQVVNSVIKNFYPNS